jgi:hypothetical protein
MELKFGCEVERISYDETAPMLSFLKVASAIGIKDSGAAASAVTLGDGGSFPEKFRPAPMETPQPSRRGSQAASRLRCSRRDQAGPAT